MTALRAAVRSAPPGLPELRIQPLTLLIDPAEDGCHPLNVDSHMPAALCAPAVLVTIGRWWGRAVRSQ